MPPQLQELPLWQPQPQLDPQLHPLIAGGVIRWGTVPPQGSTRRPPVIDAGDLPRERRDGRISRTMTCPPLTFPIRGMHLTLQLLTVINERAAAVSRVSWQFPESASREESHRPSRTPGHSVEPNLSEKHDRNGRCEHGPDEDAGHGRYRRRGQVRDQGHQDPGAAIANAGVTRETMGPYAPVVTMSAPRSRSITVPATRGSSGRGRPAGPQAIGAPGCRGPIPT